MRIVLKRLKAGNAGAGIRIDDLKISDGGHYEVHVKSIIPNSVVVGKGSVELVVYSPEPGIQNFHPTSPYPAIFLKFCFIVLRASA